MGKGTLQRRVEWIGELHCISSEVRTTDYNIETAGRNSELSGANTAETNRDPERPGETGETSRARGGFRQLHENDVMENSRESMKTNMHHTLAVHRSLTHTRTHTHLQLCQSPSLGLFSLRLLLQQPCVSPPVQEAKHHSLVGCREASDTQL